MPSLSAAHVSATSGGKAMIRVPVGQKISMVRAASTITCTVCSSDHLVKGCPRSNATGRSVTRAAACDAEVDRSVSRNVPVPAASTTAAAITPMTAAPTAAVMSSRNTSSWDARRGGLVSPAVRIRPATSASAVFASPKPRLTSRARPPVRLVATLTRKTAGVSTNHRFRGASASTGTVRAAAGQNVETGVPSGAKSTAPTPAA